MLVASVTASVIALVLQAIVVADFQGADIGSDAFGSVLETSFGRWHAVRVGLVLALAIILYGRVRTFGLDPARRRAPWWFAWGGVAIAILMSHSFSGHATVATPRLVALASDVVHLATAGIWFSGIVVLAVLLPDAWRGFPRAERLHLLAPVVLRFSRVALVTVLIAGATGTLNAFLNIGAFGHLWQTNYGRAVVGKVVLFGIILVLGAVNHFVLRERFEEARAEGSSTAAQSIFRRTIATELIVAVLILGISGVLIGLERTKDLPPGNETTSVAP
jgi:copper transport protein